jgi:hypothetical protein
MSCDSDLPEQLRDLEQERNRFLVIMYYLDKWIYYSKEHLSNKQGDKKDNGRLQKSRLINTRDRKQSDLSLNASPYNLN